MFFIEFYADWLLPCNVVSVLLHRVKNCGMLIRSDILLLLYDFCR